MNEWESVPHETPIDDISGLIPRHLKSRAQLNEAEAANIHLVTVRYLAARPSSRQASFKLNWLYKLHKQMFGDVWEWAGCRRQKELNIGVPFCQIDTSLETLLRDLECWRNSGMPPIEQAARLHHGAVLIHPFINGNGRWARMLANIRLRQLRHPMTIWPDRTIGIESEIRNEYIAAIKAADQLNMDPLIALHARYSGGSPK